MAGGKVVPQGDCSEGGFCPRGRAITASLGVAGAGQAMVRGGYGGIVLVAVLSTFMAVASCGSDGELPPATRDEQAASTDICASAPILGYGFDRFGGWKGIRLRATGRFRVEAVRGVWWFVTPDGHVLFSAGVTGVDPVGDVIRGSTVAPYQENILRRYGSFEKWADNTTERLCALGFRVLGGWMGARELDLFAERFPYTVNVDVYETFPVVRGGPMSLRPRRDVFVADALERARTLARPGSLVERCARDPWCVGVYVENEVPYLPSLLAGGGHLDVYLSEPAGSPGKQAVEEFFRERYRNDVLAFNRTWGVSISDFAQLQHLTSLGSCAPTLGYADDLCYLEEPEGRLADRLAFEAHVASHVANVAKAMLRELGSNILDLGPRLVVGPFGAEVVQALAAPADVFSTNNYDIAAFARSLLPAGTEERLRALGFTSLDPFERLTDFWKITGKPILITEWFYRRARPQGSYPPFLPEVPDGLAQAAAYRQYMEHLLSLPFVVGAHWFQWVDQPQEGRWDGENQLIGVVDIEDNLNEPLASTMAEVQRTIIPRRLALQRE